MMNKTFRTTLFLGVILIFLNSCSSSKKVTTTKYVDPYQGKTINDLNVTDRYIKTYRDVAIKEMNRARVPASITLGQGILESGNGNSYLASKGNNHFGIKCKGNWNGEKIYFDDDEKNECFRKYKSANASFKDHSEFLKNNKRYSDLFKLDSKDYKAWAIGLKKAGYATRRNYAELLIGVIEKHQLYIYDEQAVENMVASSEGLYKEFDYNKINATKVYAGDTYKKIASIKDIDLQSLLEYNDLSEDRSLKKGEIIYLGKKRSKAKESFHIIKNEDRMYSVSQDYGLRLNKLYEYNLIEEGDEPAIGEIIYLRSQRKKSPEVRIIVDLPVEKKKEKVVIAENNDETKIESPKKEVVNKEINNEQGDVIIIESSNNSEKKENEIVINDNTAFEEVSVKSEVDKKEIVKGESVNDVLNEIEKNDNQVEIEIDVVEKPTKNSNGNVEMSGVNFHFVKKGETLFSISKLHNVDVDEIKEWNKLSKAVLSIGDTLIIKAKGQKIAEKPKTEITIKETKKPENTNAVAEETSVGGDLGIVHIVKDGESLYTISRKYEKTIIDIISLNKLEEYELTTGQRLVIELPKGAKTASNDPFIHDVVKKANIESGKTESYHEVKKGETLYSISRQYKMTVSKLKSINNLATNNLRLGQKLAVEGVTKTNNLKSTTKSTTKSATKYHTVQRDDTLYSISRKYNITVNKLKELNSLQGNLVRIGQKLIIEK
ncbi:MAG: LysM peptidoglycan-binding domain-containing protein [Bacteroidota bacterium]|nr:LysM peptidoglycan-binding domain-containing protein [Bacteroidota bacterium]